MLETGPPAKLIVNGLEVEHYEHTNDLGMDENVTVLSLPDYMLLDKKNSIKWVGDIDEDDAEAVGKLLGIDSDGLINKKVRIFIQTIGPAKRPS